MGNATRADWSERFVDGFLGRQIHDQIPGVGIEGSSRQHTRESRRDLLNLPVPYRHTLQVVRLFHEH
jgi:hypothetical protein